VENAVLNITQLKEDKSIAETPIIEPAMLANVEKDLFLSCVALMEALEE